MAKSVEQTFRKLTETEHVLARPGRYIGSIKPHTSVEYVPTVVDGAVTMVKQELTYNPGFLKLFDEVISNSADHSKRPEGKHLDVIRVEVDQAKGEISVYDNGGIPVVKHAEYNQWVPELIFELRAGSNFDDSDQATLTGQNGEGAALTCIFSTKFKVETCDGKQRFLMTFSDNSRHRSSAKIVDAAEKGYTRITYFPDFEKLGMTGIDDANFAMLQARVFEIAATNTHLKVYFNGDRVMTRSFKDYVELFVGKDGEYVFDDGASFKVAVAKSEDGFTHTSFVNTTRTKIGGTHITYVVNQIVDAVREHIKKRNKIEVKPADIRNHLHLFIDATIVNPRYSSQTKDELITEPSAYGRTWTVPEKFIQRLLKTEIIQAIMDWVEAKVKAAEMAELRKLNKEAAKTNPKRVDKFDDAIEKHARHTCECFFTEGDSARNSIQSARGKSKTIGSFSLRGKPLNVYDAEIKDVIGNTEFANILAITGLQLGEKVISKTQLRFGKLVVLSDQDLDGFHITSLVLSFWAKYWPELFQLGMVYRMNTPLYIATTSKGDIHEFFTDEEYAAWAKSAPKHKADRFKGLGGFDTETFERFLQNRDKYLVRITALEAKDLAKFELAFSGIEQEARKKWLQDVRYFETHD